MLQKRVASEHSEVIAPSRAAPAAPGKRTRSGEGAPSGAQGTGAAQATAGGSAERMEDWDADSLTGAMGLDLGAAAAESGGKAALIVEDSAPAKPGQLTQTAFLAQLRAAVTKMASEVLGPTWSASSCQDIPKLFGHYAALDARGCERIAQRYSGVAAATSAVEYIEPICARLTSAIARWGGGEELSWELGSSGLPAAAEDAGSSKPRQQAGSGTGTATTAAAASEAGSAPGPAVQLKRSEGGGSGGGADSVSASDLGAGAPMDSGTAARMGGAFGTSFDHVRVHTEPEAAQKTRALGADAMAVGSHVAFAPGQYQPGTPSGDGLIAHELAHVMQQRGGEPLVQQRSVAVESSSTHEHDADQAAAAVVARLHGGDAGGESAREPIRPALATGTGVQRGNKPEPSTLGKNIATTSEAMGQHMVERMDDSNKPTDGNVHYWYNAKPKIEKTGAKWKDQYRKGHHFKAWDDPTSAFFKQPDEENKFMRFELLPQQSASAAVKAWLTGPTIGECLSAVYAMQSETVRAAIGDEKFDELYGSTDVDKDKLVRDANRQLVIAAGAAATVDPMLVSTEFSKTHKNKTAGDLQEKDYAGLKPGEWYYFRNHPLYLKKHPGGAWQGENAIFMGLHPESGQRLWSGLGAAKDTEDHMYDTMVRGYNKARDAHDYDTMISKGYLVKDGGGKVTHKGEKYRYADNTYDPDSNHFPDTTDVKGIKEAGGGFNPNSGWVLDLEQVKQAKL